MAEKDKMQWMYGGADTLVDHEKYLLGQKVDTNFELAVNEATKTKKTGMDAVLTARETAKPSSGFESQRDVDTMMKRQLIGVKDIKKEDPLVAIRTKEEQFRRELRDNPLRIHKLQNIIKEEMERKMRKIIKKQMKAEKKAHKKRKRSASSEEPESRRRQRSSTPERRSPRASTGSRHDSRGSHRRSHGRHSHSSHHHHHDKTKDENRRSRRASSPEDIKPAPVEQNRSKHSPDVVPLRRRHDSSDEEEPTSSKAPPTRSRRSPSYSDSDEERKKRKWAGYGLVKASTKKEGERKSTYEADTFTLRYTERVPIDVPWRRPTAKPELLKKKREKLTDEERQKRLEEMKQNAVWRDEQRTETLKRAEAIEKDLKRRERESLRKGDGVNLITETARGSENDNLEDRIKRQRGRLQRNERDYDRSFIKR